MTGVAPVESGRAEVGGTIYSRDETFDASGSGVNLSGRLGLAEAAETNLTLRLGSLGPESRVSPQTLQWATRVGSRLSALGLTRSLSADIGLGVGGHHGGLFVSPDLGLTVGYDNPYVVPFARIDGWLSVPLASSEQDVIIDDTTDGEPVWGTQSPVTTRGYMLRFGVRVPLRHEDHHPTVPSLGCVLGWGELADSTQNTTVFEGSCGLMVEFPVSGQVSP